MSFNFPMALLGAVLGFVIHCLLSYLIILGHNEYSWGNTIPCALGVATGLFISHGIMYRNEQ